MVVWILVAGLGLEIGHHRYFSHSSFECSRTIARIMAFLGSLSLTGTPVFWAAVHRGFHHKYTDTERDIHSPIHGLWYSYIGWTFDSKVTDSIPIAYAGKKCLGDSFIMFLQKHYYMIVISFFLLVFLISPSFFFLSFIPAIFLAFNQGLIVNVLCHNEKFGYVNYNIPNSSRNSRWLSLLTFGLALHNNHHKFPSVSNYAMNKYEVDPGYILMRLLRLV
jgi:stearoyl-CoA desaturase (delta-9 desaturase)